MSSIQLKDPNLPPPPSGKYPAKLHARKVADWIAKHDQSEATAKGRGSIYLEAQKTHMTEDDDQEAPFRQRRHFYYLSGCNLPDSYLIYDIDRDHLTLFIPPIDADDVIWSGLPEQPKDALIKYDIDACLTSPDLNPHLASLPPAPIHHILAQLSPTTTFPSTLKPLPAVLKLAIDTCRVTKTPHEIALIRHANAISSSAHENAMRTILHATNEAESMAAFVGTSIANGGREQAYACICASGTSAATLHYVHNDLPLTRKLNMLMDAGAEYACYCADITRTYPLSGTFTAESRAIYALVARMQDAVFAILRAGVRWEDVHATAHRVAVDGLLALGVLLVPDGESRESLWDSRVSTVFFPHGLGHYLGMDTHDSGGNPDYEDKDPMFRYLRVRGVVPEDAVVTNEPGVYFCRFIVEPAMRDARLGRFIDRAVVERYWDVGGVRIEDDVWIRKDGYENLTTVTRDVDEIERLVKGEA